MRNISFTIFFLISITCLVIILNNVFILNNKNIKILFNNKKFILYCLRFKNMFLDYFLTNFIF